MISPIDKFVIITVFMRCHDDGHMNIQTKPAIRDPKQPTGMKNAPLEFANELSSRFWAPVCRYLADKTSWVTA